MRMSDALTARMHTLELDGSSSTEIVPTDMTNGPDDMGMDDMGSEPEMMTDPMGDMEMETPAQDEMPGDSDMEDYAAVMDNEPEVEESYSPGDENEEGMVSNCCGAPIMDVYQGHGRCSDCKEMASAEKVEESVNETFEPHMMYDPKTGKSKMTNTEAEHLKLKDMGWSHDKPKKSDIKEGTKGCADCEWIKDETDGDIDTCDECAAEKRKTNESGILYKAGKNKYGKEGMKKIQSAAGKGASAEEIGRIKDQHNKKKKKKATEAVVEEVNTSGDYANVFYDYKEDFYMVDVYKDGKKVAEDDGYFGANATGNPLITVFLKLVKQAGLEAEGLRLVSTGGDEPDENGVFKNGKFNWNKSEGSEKDEKTIRRALDKAETERGEKPKKVSVKKAPWEESVNEAKSSILDQLQSIADNKQAKSIKFDDGSSKVDMFTASAITQVHAKVNDDNKAKIEKMLNTRSGLMKVAKVAMGALKEGKLDEILPAVGAVAGGVARAAAGAVGGLARGAAAAAKHAPKISKAVKVGRNIKRVGKAVGGVAGGIGNAYNAAAKSIQGEADETANRIMQSSTRASFSEYNEFYKELDKAAKSGKKAGDTISVGGKNIKLKSNPKQMHQLTDSDMNIIDSLAEKCKSHRK
jgi:hypothetical protein